MTDREIALTAKALSDENRIAILRLLTQSECCACELLEAFSFSQPTLSHHMKILSESRLVEGRKEGKWTYYSLNSPHFQAFKKILSELAPSKSIRIQPSAFKKNACEKNSLLKKTPPQKNSLLKSAPKKSTQKISLQKNLLLENLRA